MKVTRGLKQIVHKIDHVVLKLMGEGRSSQKKIVIPKNSTAAQLRRKLISDYVQEQPSLLQVVLLKLYISVRHTIGSISKYILCALRGFRI